MVTLVDIKPRQISTGKTQTNKEVWIKSKYEEGPGCMTFFLDLVWLHKHIHHKHSFSFQLRIRSKSTKNKLKSKSGFVKGIF